MILILTFSYYEQGTDPVAEWLLHYQAPFIRVCVEDLLNKSNGCVLDVNKGRLFVDGFDVTDLISVVFFRRFYRYLQFENKETLGEISRKLFNETNAELLAITEFLYEIFQDKTWFPKPEVHSVNKLKITHVASRLGIRTPASIITNSRQELEEFRLRMKGQVITKAIERLSYYTFGKYTYNSYTVKVDDEALMQLPDFFFPTLFQEAIEASYEIRIFYLDGDFFATAAVSSNQSRSVDLKQSFDSKQLHWVPYNLPQGLKSDLHRLMQDIGLVTGSIDVILDRRGRYHFIEVNPAGQYNAPSHSSNYYLEKKIAEWLIRKTN